MMRRLSTLALVGILFAAAAAFAYVPAPPELAQLWQVQRPLRAPLLLRYVASERRGGARLTIYVHPKGYWYVGLRRRQHTKRQWRFGDRVWIASDAGWQVRRRPRPSWEDWLFEPDFAVLERLEPRESFAVRALGRHPEGWLWLYGARHDRARGRWFGLLERPVRLGLWHSSRRGVGSILFRYGRGWRYPDEIRFQRPGRRDYVLRKELVVWDPAPRHQPPRPPEEVLAAVQAIAETAGR